MIQTMSNQVLAIKKVLMICKNWYDISNKKVKQESEIKRMKQV